MIPILFEESERYFTTNGLGRLSDAISCTVTEERNGSYELHMEYPQAGVLIEELRNSRLIYAMPADNKSPQPFRIYRISKPLSGVVEIDAEHISYQMIHIPIMPFKTDGIQNAISKLRSYAAETVPFQIQIAGHFDARSTNSFSVNQPTNLRSVLFGQEGSFLDTYGGEWEFDGFTATLHGTGTSMDGRGSDNGVTIRYGKNLTDLKQEENIQNTYTGVCPFWKGVVTGDSGGEEEKLVTLRERVVHSDKAANFPYQRTKIVDFTTDYQNPPTEDQLRTRAERYIRENDVGKPNVSLKVSFIALHQTQEYANLVAVEHINLCDTVTVVFPALDISTKAKVVRTVFNTLQERYDSIDIGSLSSNLGSSLMQTANEAAQSAVTQAKETSDGSYATKGQLAAVYTDVQTLMQTMFGQNGGRVVTITDTENKPKEILILLDSSKLDTATKLYKWDYTGIKYTEEGYEGKYVTILDANGHFQSDYLRGTLGDGSIATWNLATGVANFTMEKFTLDHKSIPTLLEAEAKTAVDKVVEDTLPGMISDGIAADVPDMISDAIDNEMPGVAQRKVYELVPGLIRTQVNNYDAALNAPAVRTKLGGLDMETVLLPTEITEGAVTAYTMAKVIGGVIYPENYQEASADDPEEPIPGDDGGNSEEPASGDGNGQTEPGTGEEGDSPEETGGSDPEEGGNE